MPYNPGGIFSLVASYFANPGTTIRTEQHNPPLEDIASALSSVYIRDGRAPMTGPLNMNGFAINNVVAGNSPNSVATLAQATPIGVVADFAGTSAPAGWLLCFGQAISRSVYSGLFAIIGTTYGVGDGSTTFNLPDCRGRVVAGPDNMGGPAAGRLTTAYFGSNGLFATSGGAESHNLTTAQIPAHTHPNTLNDPGHAHSYTRPLYNQGGTSGPGGASLGSDSPSTGSATTGITITNAANTGGGGAHLNIQPTLILNKIIKASYDG